MAKKTKKVIVKSASAPVKKIHIFKDWTTLDGDCYAFGHSSKKVMTTGYSRADAARRGAARHNRKFTDGGGRLVYVKQY